MQHVLSRDGTSIAFESIGAGPALVFVVGAFNDHTTGAELARALSGRFTVTTYDRRGRGESGDTPPYATEREVEDLAAVLSALADGSRGSDLSGATAGAANASPAGGAEPRGAAVFGFSSGAILALQAAAAGLPIGRLAVYDAPYAVTPASGIAVAVTGDSAERPTAESTAALSDETSTGTASGGGAGGSHADRLATLLADGRRGEAVEYFQCEMVGIPRETVVRMRQAPFRPALEAMSHTLVYDASLVGNGSLPSTALANRITQPTLVVAGGGSAAMADAARALAALLPRAECQIVPDQGHDLVAATLAPRLTEFLTQPNDESVVRQQGRVTEPRPQELQASERDRHQLVGQGIHHCVERRRD